MNTPLDYLNIFFVTVFALASHAQSGAIVNGQPGKQLIEENNKLYFACIAKRDATNFARRYTPDCWIMVPDLPVHCGPEAPIDYFNILIQKEIVVGKFITIDLYGVSEDAAEVGFYRFCDNSGNEFDNGKYVVLWKKMNGQWKKHRESISSTQ